MTKTKKIQHSTTTTSSSSDLPSSSSTTQNNNMQPIATKRTVVQQTLDALPWQVSMDNSNLRDDVMEEGLGMIEEIPADSYEIEYLPGGGVIIRMLNNKNNDTKVTKDKEDMKKKKKKEDSKDTNNIHDRQKKEGNKEEVVGKNVCSSSNSNSSSSSIEKGSNTMKQQQQQQQQQKTSNDPNNSSDTVYSSASAEGLTPLSSTIGPKDTDTIKKQKKNKNKQDKDTTTVTVTPLSTDPTTTTGDKVRSTLKDDNVITKETGKRKRQETTTTTTVSTAITSLSSSSSSPLHAVEEDILTSSSPSVISNNVPKPPSTNQPTTNNVVSKKEKNNKNNTTNSFLHITSGTTLNPPVINQHISMVPKLGPVARTGVSVSDIQEAWNNVHVTNSLLLQNLASLGYLHPTSIQERTIPNALLYYKDIIGTAETGSGKTLAYSLPIIHRLLERRERLNMLTTKLSSIDTPTVSSSSSSSSSLSSIMGTHFSFLPALIITPTRELAVQVRDHITALTAHTAVKVISIVGGLAPEKQDRILRLHPDIIVGTPGRLWDVIRSHNYSFLNRLDTLQFLVLDEADRLVEKGSFEALNNILNLLKQQQTAKSLNNKKNTASSTTGEDATFVDEIAEKIIKKKSNKLRSTNGNVSLATDQTKDDTEAVNGTLTTTLASSSTVSTTKIRYVDPPSHYKRQTFLFSATLGVSTGQSVQNAAEALVHATTETDTRDGSSVHVSKKAKQRALAQAIEMTPVEALMVRVGMLGKTELISTTTTSTTNSASTTVPNNNSRKEKNINQSSTTVPESSADTDEPEEEEEVNSSSSNVRTTSSDVIVALPPGLELGRITCSDAQDKDVRLYTFLSQYSGRSLIFVNAISTLKRLYSLLSSLQLPVYTLHAHMLQKQRLSHLERYREHANSILIATDVAARGLDIPDVDYVLHYMLPLSAETFVHRCGRTARGPNKQGLALAYVSPLDSAMYTRIMNVLHFTIGLPEFPLDQQYLTKFIPRIALGRQIADNQALLDKETELTHWLTNTTKEAELGMDDTLITALGSNKGQIILMNEHNEELQRNKKRKITNSQVPLVKKQKIMTDDDDNDIDDDKDDNDISKRNTKDDFTVQMDEDERSEAYAHAKLLRQQLNQLRKRMLNVLKESILPTGFISRKYISSTQTYQQSRNTQGLSIKSLITVNPSTIRSQSTAPVMIKGEDSKEEGKTTEEKGLVPSNMITTSNVSSSNGALRAPRIFISHGSSTVTTATTTTNDGTTTVTDKKKNKYFLPSNTTSKSVGSSAAFFPQQTKTEALALLQDKGKYRYIPAVQKAQVRAKHAFQLQKHKQNAKFKSL